MYGGLKKSASRLALVAAAGVLSTNAYAADLGGDCCADLEERVAELEATTVRKGTRKTSVELWGLVNQAITGWGDGSRSNATIGYGNHNLQTRFGIRGSAKISPTASAGYSLVLDVADKARTSTFSQLQDTGGSKLGIRNDDYAMRLRDANWWIESSLVGRFTVGRITDETVVGSPDVAGIQHAVGDDVGCNGGGLRFRTNAAPTATNPGGTTPTSLGGYTAGGCAGPWANRLQGIKWQSPTLAGFQLLAAYGPNIKRDANTVDTAAANVANSGNSASVGARYAGEFSGVRIAANVGYNVNDLVKEENFYTDAAPFLSGRTKLLNAGLGLVHVPTGLFAQGEWSRLTVQQQGFTGVGVTTGLTAERDATRWHVAAGIGQNWFGIGKTTLYGEYMKSNNFQYAYGPLATLGALNTVATASTLVSGDGITTWGLGFNQAIDAAAMDLYVNFRNHKLADPNFAAGVSANSLQVVTAGARIRF
jgi:hypothetical protein